MFKYALVLLMATQFVYGSNKTINDQRLTELRCCINKEIDYKISELSATDEVDSTARISKMLIYKNALNGRMQALAGSTRALSKPFVKDTYMLKCAALSESSEALKFVLDYAGEDEPKYLFLALRYAVMWKESSAGVDLLLKKGAVPSLRGTCNHEGLSVFVMEHGHPCKYEGLVELAIKRGHSDSVYAITKAGYDCEKDNLKTAIRRYETPKTDKFYLVIKGLWDLRFAWMEGVVRTKKGYIIHQEQTAKKPRVMALVVDRTEELARMARTEEIKE